MKSILYQIFFVCYIVLIAGCSNDDFGVTPKESSLNLISPNGIKIAKDIITLKRNTSAFISSFNDGMEIEIEITNIEYVNVSKGFVAIIEYKFDNGDISTYALFSNLGNVELSAYEMIMPNFPKLKSGSESGGLDPSKIKCISSGTPCPPPNNECKLYFQFGPDGLLKSAYCTMCETCSMVVSN